MVVTNLLLVVAVGYINQCGHHTIGHILMARLAKIYQRPESQSQN